MKKLLTLITAISVIAFTLAGCSSKNAGSTAEGSNKDSKTANSVVKIGVVGENNEQWKPVIDKLAKEGITIELVKFADYSLPNQALADKEIDLNAFQHYAYLNNQIKEKKLELTPIGETIIAPLGIYSKKIKNLIELKEGDKVAIPNDATNGGRSLKLLESAGLIKVKPEAGYVPKLSDITENPLKLQIIEIEAAQTPRLLPDVAIAVINGGHAVDAGLYPKKDSIFLEKVTDGSNNPYINIIVSRTADKDNATYKKVVDAFRTPEVAKVIEDVYKGSYLPTWK